MLSQSGETMGVLVGLVGSMLLAVLLLLGMTGGGFFLALVVLAMLSITLAFLSLESIMSHQTATVSEAPEISPMAAIAPAATRTVPWAVIAGSVALLGVYLVGMTVLEGTAHTSGHLRGDWPMIAGVMAGFGILVGFAVDAVANDGLRGKALAIGVMGTGVGMVGLFACCTPLLTRFLAPQYVLPAATLAVQYSTLIAIVGISANLVISLAIRRADLQTASSP